MDDKDLSSCQRFIVRSVYLQESHRDVTDCFTEWTLSRLKPNKRDSMKVRRRAVDLGTLIEVTGPRASTPVESGTRTDASFGVLSPRYITTRSPTAT
ncbi:hypothetical protein T265_07984 [Opisthorchis viverrini]|uniref:Uncharacterized protein n=1 Tax=Opisthorchis viverrini TaxID=6198 RepID=A0A074ZAM4_OPIVI|nr:hypothetical protein T265_07984 [Opisthorchis viverrini]KER24346.1 hypothetical protein T265_07984 [Opisthorchis viverrini]